MSQENSFLVNELKRDRYARTAEASYRLKTILLPCVGLGIRGKADLDTVKNLRLNFETSHLGFCVTQLAYSDNTFISLSKTIEESKLKPELTADEKQDLMFYEKTLLAVEPSTDSTLWASKNTLKKMQTSLEVPEFLRDYARTVLKQREILGSDTQNYRDWKERFFLSSWYQIESDADLRDDLILASRSSQITCKADMLIPPTNPIISRETFHIAKGIMEQVSSIWTSSTAVYFIIHQSVLKDKDLVAEILEYYEKSNLPILILKIKDTNLTDPDKFDLRNVYEDIQKKFCEIRMNDHKKCTILLDAGKLTFPSLVRGFDIVTNHISGKNEFGGGRPKKGDPPLDKHSPYYMREKMVRYRWALMNELARNELQRTNNEHALTCSLPCCSGIKTFEGMTVNYWNYSVVRPHFALTMNEEAKFVSGCIYGNKIQSAKEPLLKSELCVLKNLIPDV